jgi:DNA-binding CsgD family transcriptional regulator
MTVRGASLATNRNTSRPVLPGPGGTAYLTPRQAEVLELATRGLNDKQIAARLKISRRTVRDRFDEMRERTGTRTRAELVARAAEAGLVRPAPSVPPAGPTTGQGWPEEPTQQHNTGKRTIPLYREDVTEFPAHPQHFVDNETLRMRNTDMASLSGTARNRVRSCRAAPIGTAPR